MKTLVAVRLDTRKVIEDSLKRLINFPVPKFILRNIVDVVINCLTPQDIHMQLSVYIEKCFREKVTLNEKLLLEVKRVLIDENAQYYLRYSIKNINYNELVEAKESLLWEDRNDKYELSSSTKKSLDNVIREGISIKVNVLNLKQQISLTALNYIKNTDIPLSSQFSDYRVVQINNFKGSKISHLVHDLFDHLCVFSYLRDLGFFAVYEEFWQRVGNPAKRDIFSRESELIASIAYERRHAQCYSSIFELPLKNGKISLLINQYFPLEKAQYMEKLSFLSQKNISVYHIYYNVLCELWEQIRKVWAIKLINNKGALDGDITTVLHTHYLKIVIDVLYQIAQKEESFKKMLLDVYAYIEVLLHTCMASSLEEYETKIHMTCLRKYAQRNNKYNKSIKAFFNL